MNESNHRSAGSDSLADLFATLTADKGERHRPFRWQRRLLERLRQGELPEAVDVPTGLGKTAVMALWLIALGKGAKLPRRLVYVVDRRAVVDQATRYAERLRQNLPKDLARELGVAERGGDLPISTLRGGFADNRAWQEDPSVPAIVVGTVDMIGSRLLFRGYGVSKGMRPYLAGLLGADALVVLDEAHLCPPFEALLRQVVDHRDDKLGPLVDVGAVTPPFRLMSLSATGRQSAGLEDRDVFTLLDEDRSEQTVCDRLNADKRLLVERVEDSGALAEKLAQRTVEIGASPEGQRARIIVYSHSRKVAVDVKARIDKECRRGSGKNRASRDWATELLVGERRVHERAELEGWLEEQGFLGGSRLEPEAPAVLVATSAGEVGVDLDADHLVCDLVPYERMVQRLGRVNRRGGRDRRARVEVLAAQPPSALFSGSKAEREKRAAEAVERWWAPLKLLRPLGGSDRYNASPASTVELKERHLEIVRAATTQAPLHPELTRPLLDAWAMTSLDQHEGRPEVAPWLRGWEEVEEPQTEVVWRRHLPSIQVDDGIELPAALATEYFRAAPIHATEKLEASTSRVFDWLLKRAAWLAKRQQADPLFVGADEIVGVLLDREHRHRGSFRGSDLRTMAAPVRALSEADRKERDAQKRKWKESLQQPGALLVVDARLGGLRDGMLNERENNKAVTADSDRGWQDLKQGQASDAPPVIGFRIQEVVRADDGEGLVEPVPSVDWRHFRTFETAMDSGGTPVRGLAVLTWADEPLNEDVRSAGARVQVLSEHAAAVVDRVRAIACRLDLPSWEREALAKAACLHDEGKAAPRWQRAMNAPQDGSVYAKTGGGGDWRALEGYRHEFGSLLDAETRELPAETRDLVLHLIASHHGRARPLIPPGGCDAGPPSLLEIKAGDAALRFAKLQRRYGPWGLAWREAILRAADQSASRSAKPEDGERSG